MGQLLLILVVPLVVVAVVVGVVAVITSGDPGLGSAEPDDRAVPLPMDRPLIESDLAGLRFDTGLRGYRMSQVDRALRRAAYDIGYKDELIGVLEAEVVALRAGRVEDADVLRRAREAALSGAAAAVRTEAAARTEAATDTDDRSEAETEDGNRAATDAPAGTPSTPHDQSVGVLAEAPVDTDAGAVDGAGSAEPPAALDVVDAPVRR